MNEDNVDIELPDIFPQSNVNVEEEPHIFDVKEGSLEDLKKLEYTLNKAPIYGIKRVTGTRQGSEYTFEKGVDYELSNDANRLIWLENNLPDDNTEFYVTYQSESIISRFISSSEKELEISEEHINEVIDSKFISTAEGNELDELGKLFGPTIGQRRGRNDDEYRVYLRSVVQSFTSRGTKTGIKLAISAATDIPIEDIEIIEDFRNNEYSIGILPQTPVAGTLLEDVAEIADPSGIKQLSTRYRPEPDETVVDDDYLITEGNLFTEDLSIDSLAEVNPNLTTRDEAVTFDDLAEVSPDLTTRDEAITVDDDKTVNPNLFETAEDITLDDAVSDAVEENINQYKWSPLEKTVVEDTGSSWDSENWGEFEWKQGTTVTQETDDNVNWNFFEWTELLDLERILSDDFGATDNAYVDRDTLISPETTGLDDSVLIDPDTLEIVDVGGSDDTVFIDRNQNTTAETAKVSDGVEDVTEENPDAYRWSALRQTQDEPTGNNWGSVDWGNFDWKRDTGVTQDADADVHWNFFQWNDLVDLGTIALSDTLGPSDSHFIDRNTGVINDTFKSADEALIDQNTSNINDVTGSDDTVIIDATTADEDTSVSDTTTNNVTARTTHEWAQYEQTAIDATGDDWDSDNWSAYEQTVVEPTGDEWDTEDWNTLEWVESGTIEDSTSGTFEWAGDTSLEDGASGKEWDFFEWRQPA